jgi:YrbI family 3-deoxy-D-manno-octulosonate 8-phosphate phosphatase
VLIVDLDKFLVEDRLSAHEELTGLGVGTPDNSRAAVDLEAGGGLTKHSVNHPGLACQDKVFGVLKVLVWHNSSFLKKGYRVAIISGARDQNVITRLQYLGITDIFINVENKLPVYETYIKKNNLLPKEVLYMGDDIPDIPLLKKVGLSAAPHDAVTEVLNAVDYISLKNGGETCVRDVIEQVLRVQGQWQFNFDENDIAAN